jgi:hypothetical protein
MNTLKLTAKDFKKSAGNYLSDYVGSEDVTNHEGHIDIEADLGWIRFAASLKTSGHIFAKAGTGIEAGGGNEAGGEGGEGEKAN